MGKNVETLQITCQSCLQKNELQGVFTLEKSEATNIYTSGLRCPNHKCEKLDLWGYLSHFDFFNSITNLVNLMIRRHISEYGKFERLCDDPSCHLKTRQRSVSGDFCLARGCNGTMEFIYTEKKLDTQIKYIR